MENNFLNQKKVKFEGEECEVDNESNEKIDRAEVGSYCEDDDIDIEEVIE
jgi:hypothetical protein